MNDDTTPELWTIDVVAAPCGGHVRGVGQSPESIWRRRRARMISPCVRREGAVRAGLGFVYFSFAGERQQPFAALALGQHADTDQLVQRHHRPAERVRTEPRLDLAEYGLPRSSAMGPAAAVTA